MPDADEIVDILLSQAAGRIDFSFSTPQTASVTVNATTFTTIAALIRSGRITVRRGGVTEEGATAQYTIAENTIHHIGGLGMRYWRSAIIHEAVHAFSDYQKRRTLIWVDDETAAFLAQAVYLMRVGYPRARWRGGFALLYEIANTIISSGRPTVEQVNTLRNLIMVSPGYRRQLMELCQCDTREELLQVQSEYDGVLP